jgi:hypothetical protein
MGQDFYAVQARGYVKSRSTASTRREKERKPPRNRLYLANVTMPPVVLIEIDIGHSPRDKRAFFPIS